MKTFESQPLLLLFMVTLAITKHPNGSHTLRYLYTLLSWPGPLEPQLIFLSYVDDTEILGFNSISENLGVESRAPWMDKQTANFWQEAKDDVLNEQYTLKEMMRNALYIYNYSIIGYHTIQKTYGCQVIHRKYFSHGFFELAFNLHDYITLNKDLKTWTVGGKASEILKEEWEKKKYATRLKPYLQGSCVRSLLRYVTLGKNSLLRTDTPKIHLTHKTRPDRKITLRCWAFNFYPPEITLAWKRDGSNQTQDMEVIENRPSGDGTFQKWAAVVVFSGEEHRYTCHANHEGLSEPITMRWAKHEPPEPTIPFLAIVIALVLGALLMGSVMTFLIWKRRTRGKKESCSSFMYLWK
ncbi:HLA class I histocompatibility antigen, A-32 alpha chain-like [Mus pahari]|uniref:HLA class I histocompatibility antigen, A-32 alpha chain-like n=1 Tax=Mus pahari TaxID=10093 RepID=UPI000A30C3FA|nr:HLA class I histocompatibility antigen, A-32 alpha chain-like [Mus pahari]